MKVKQCEKCKHYERHTWSEKYYPNGYHCIGMTHAYGYCTKYEERCANVKKCKEHDEK